MVNIFLEEKSSQESCDFSHKRFNSVDLERYEADIVISLDIEVEENLPKLKKAVEEFCCDNDIYFERILIEL